MQHESLRAYARRLYLGADIFRYADDVVHYLYGIFKHVGVYALQNIVFNFAVADKIHLISGVDMPVGYEFETTVLTCNAEFAANVFNFLVHCFNSLTYSNRKSKQKPKKNTFFI